MFSKIKNLIIIFALLILAGTNVLVVPAFVYAASSSVIVGQPSATGVDPEPGSTGGGSTFDYAAPIIAGVRVSVTSDSATINWNTNELAAYQVAWGASQDYRLGNLVKNKFGTQHSALITDLSPNTTYYFQIVTADTSNNQSTYRGTFVTLTPPDTEAPSNVEYFTAQPQTNRIQLSWNNPPEGDFDFVRIIKSNKFFPVDPLNGQVLYEGKGSNFYDADVVIGKIYYYAAFARDVAGNYSSGAVAYAMIPTGDGVNVDPNAPTVDLQLPSIKNLPSLPSAFKDFNFSLPDGISFDLEKSRIPVGQSLEISIPKEKLPEDGSFLTLTVADPGKKTASSTYLFVYDHVNNNFKVKTPAFKVPKNYALVVTVFNSTKLIIEKVAGSVEVVNEAQASNGESDSSQGLPRGIILGVAGVAAIIVTVHFWRLVRLRQKLALKTKEDNQELM